MAIRILDFWSNRDEWNLGGERLCFRRFGIAGEIEQVKGRGVGLHSELAEHQDEPAAMLLIKAGMRKEIGKRQRVQ